MSSLERRPVSQQSRKPSICPLPRLFAPGIMRSSFVICLPAALSLRSAPQAAPGRIAAEPAEQRAHRGAGAAHRRRDRRPGPRPDGAAQGHLRRCLRVRCCRPPGLCAGCHRPRRLAAGARASQSPLVPARTRSHALRPDPSSHQPLPPPPISLPNFHLLPCLPAPHVGAPSRDRPRAARAAGSTTGCGPPTGSSPRWRAAPAR